MASLRAGMHYRDIHARVLLDHSISTCPCAKCRPRRQCSFSGVTKLCWPSRKRQYALVSSRRPAHTMRSRNCGMPEPIGFTYVEEIKDRDGPKQRPSGGERGISEKLGKRKSPPERAIMQGMNLHLRSTPIGRTGSSGVNSPQTKEKPALRGRMEGGRSGSRSY